MWSPSPAFAVACAVLWLVPLLRIALAPARLLRRRATGPRPLGSGLAEWTGAFEYHTALLRDPLATIAALVLLVMALFGSARPAHPCLLAALVALAHFLRRLGNRCAIGHLLRHPDVHPDDAFRVVWHSRSVWPPGALETRDTHPAEIDFTGRPPRPPWLALALATLDTATLGALVTYASGVLPRADFRVLFDAATRLWSTRVASHLRLRLVVAGQEHLADVRHQAVIVLNHESVLDFCLSFYALTSVHTGRGRRLAPRFLAAKDHFRDNPFIHTVLGVGRAMAAAGMVFVDRRTRGAGRRAVDDSVAALRAGDVDLAMFPQGTRAAPHREASGEVYGAGYYTTAPGGVPGRGHFRRGAASIAARLSREKPVDVVCMGVVGTSAVMPARSLRLRTHRTVRYQLLPPLNFEEGSPLDEEEITRRIELALRRTTGVNRRLLAAWARETGREEADIERMAQSLAAWDDSDDPIPFATLDAILSREPAARRQWLAELEGLAERNTTAAEWDAFRSMVARP